MKPGYRWIFILTIITSTFYGCKFNTSKDADLPPDNVDPNCLANKPTEDSKEKLLDMALKISGKKLSAEEQNMVMRVLNLSEEDLIRGLNACAEFSDGQYPTSLDHETVIKQTEAWGLTKYGKYDNLTASQKKEIEKKMYDAFLAASYYKRLIKKHKAPAYYGDKITAKDKNAALIHWKESDGKYRVVWGDLRIETIAAEKLAEPEKASVK